MNESFSEDENYFLENYPEMSRQNKEVIKNVIFALNYQSNPLPSAVVPEQDV